MTVGTQYRQSAEYTEFYIGEKSRCRFTVYEGTDVGGKRPHDLSSYDTVHLLFFDADGDSSARLDVPLTVLTDDADKVLDSDGTTLVAARCQADVEMSGAAGTVRCKVIGKQGANIFRIDKPWLAEVFLGGPNS